MRTIKHSSPIESGTGKWDLLTNDNLSAAFGVYVYHVDAGGLGEKLESCHSEMRKVYFILRYF